MKLSDFDYSLPKELIAQFPNENRDESRLLVLHRDTEKIEHRLFKEIVGYIYKGDVLVLNDTKVIPARLIGKKETGGKVEVLLLNTTEKCKVLSVKLQAENEFEALVKPRRGIRSGSRIDFGDGELSADVKRIQKGRITLKFNCNGNLSKVLDKFGKAPLPPYIKREPIDIDRKRYQTIYAKKEGAIAAPTAGLHFTKELLKNIKNKGIDIEYVTLHVGYGTFKPVRCKDISAHKIEEEYFVISKDTIEKLKEIKDKGGRVIAVGTTTSRVLETVFNQGINSKIPNVNPNGKLCGRTGLFIYPPYRFRFVDILITNFHLPKTSLLLLVSAFCGRELLFRAYREAIEKKYRFFSYGDAMLIL